MRTSLLLTILISSLNTLCVSAFAVEIPDLPAFAEAPANPVNNELKAEPACNEVVTRLEAYNADIYTHNQSVLAFLDQVAQTASNWQTLLFPLENQTVTVPEGKFISLQDNATAIENVTSFAYDNSAYFAAELDQIITALKNCKLSAK